LTLLMKPTALASNILVAATERGSTIALAATTLQLASMDEIPNW